VYGRSPRQGGKGWDFQQGNQEEVGIRGTQNAKGILGWTKGSFDERKESGLKLLEGQLGIALRVASWRG